MSILRVQDFFAGVGGAAVSIRKGGKGTSLAVGEGSVVCRHGGQGGGRAVGGRLVGRYLQQWKNFEFYGGEACSAKIKRIDGGGKVGGDYV